MAESDKGLAVRAAEGDKEAFAELVERHVRTVTALALATVGSREDARDIAQESFVEAYRRLRELRDPARFRSWVCGIAKRKGIYLLRSRGRASEVPLDAGAVRAAGSDEATPEERAQAAERRAIVLGAVGELPEGSREVVLMKYVADLTCREIAGALSLSEDAVEKRLSRARDALRERLKELLDIGGS